MIRYTRPVLLLLLLFLTACDAEFLASQATPTIAAATATPEPTLEPSPTAIPPTVTAPAADTPTATTIPDTPTIPPPTSTPEEMVDQSPTTPPTPSDHCRMMVLDDTTAYNRPNVEAAAFSTLTPNVPVRAEGITADGWIGFDPGITQAPNVGPFRQRWVPTGPGILLEGGTCDQLPIVNGPPPGVCFAMLQMETFVLAGPAAESVIVAPLPSDVYAQAIGRSGDEWVLVDLSLGNVGLDLQGWIPMGSISGLNGPCENLPEVSTSS